jgi:hypothetical protein
MVTFFIAETPLCRGDSSLNTTAVQSACRRAVCSAISLSDRRLCRRRSTIPPQQKVRLAEAAERLVQLYVAWGRKDQAETWRRQVDGPAAAKP